MIHAIFTFIFVVVVTTWLNFEFKRQVSISSHWRFLATILVIQLFASFVSILVGGIRGNFILHSVGGGVAAACLFFYFEKQFDFRPAWRINIVLLFMFVSALGVMNELAEFAYELMHLGVLSPDAHDTWRDLTANTIGALLTAVIFSLIYARSGSSTQQRSSTSKIKNN